MRRDSNPWVTIHYHLLSRQTLSTTQPLIRPALLGLTLVRGYLYANTIVLGIIWGNRTRTYAWLHQKQLPYRLGYTPIIKIGAMRGYYHIIQIKA